MPILLLVLQPGGRRGKAAVKEAQPASYDAWNVLPAMPWWDAADLGRAGKTAIEQGLGSEPAYSMWEVDTALRAAHMLVSQMLYAMHLGRPMLCLLSSLWQPCVCEAHWLESAVPPLQELPAPDKHLMMFSRSCPIALSAFCCMQKGSPAPIEHVKVLHADIFIAWPSLDPQDISGLSESWTLSGRQEAPGLVKQHQLGFLGFRLPHKADLCNLQARLIEVGCWQAEAS